MEPRTDAGERSIAEILTDIGRNARAIVRAEIRLAKLEAQAQIRIAGRGAILLAAGGTICLLALALLSMAGIHLLATVVALWIAALIVAALAAVIGGLLISAGLKQMRTVTLTLPKTVAAITLKGTRSMEPRIAPSAHSFFGTAIRLLKQTAKEWSEDKAPQLGAALAYYTVFSLAPLVLLIIAIVGLVFRHDPAGAWTRITTQMSYVLDKSAVDVVQGIANGAAQPGKSAIAVVIGIVLALIGAGGVFGQLQDALNTIWGVKAKPGLGAWGFVRARFASFAMVGGVCFMLLVSLMLEGLLKGFSHWIQAQLPGGLTMAVTLYLVLDFAVVVVLFAMIFKVLPDVEIRWRDVWVGALMTALLFLAGKWAIGLYLASGSAGSAYGAASSLITLLLWIYYSSQLLLFGAEFTQVYATYSGAPIIPNKYAVAIDGASEVSSHSAST